MTNTHTDIINFDYVYTFELSLTKSDGLTIHMFLLSTYSILFGNRNLAQLCIQK